MLIGIKYHISKTYSTFVDVTEMVAAHISLWRMRH
jgi:hypothetical protein